jgi:small subunit ribosomal protein S1
MENFAMDASKGSVMEKPTEIKPKMHFKGKVVKVGLAGAVVDIGSEMPALIHVSQIEQNGSEPIKRVEDVLHVDQEIDVWVRRVRDKRIELTMFKPLDLEWREIKKGMTVKGKVVRMEKFGAFVEIGAERPGLVHISEITHGYIRVPNDVLSDGEEVEAQVLEVNRRKKQIKLSMKALLPEPENILEEKHTSETNKFDAQRNKPSRRRRPRPTEEPSAEGGVQEVSDEEQKEKQSDTAMAVKLREALEKSKNNSKQHEDKLKKTKGVSQEQEDIIARTLDQRSSS